MSRALSKSTNDKRKKYFCVRCRLPYASREKLMKHDEECGLENEAQAKEMPPCPKHENDTKNRKVSEILGNRAGYNGNWCILQCI